MAQINVDYRLTSLKDSLAETAVKFVEPSATLPAFLQCESRHCIMMNTCFGANVAPSTRKPSVPKIPLLGASIQNPKPDNAVRVARAQAP